MYQDSATHKVFGVDFVDSLHGFATGANWNNSTGFVFYTSDGGKNWQDSQFLKSGTFWDIGFTDDKNGWITGDGKILNTTDGGITWKTQIVDSSSYLRELILLKKEKTAYIFGEDYFYGPPFILLFSDLSDVTGILANGENIPKEFRLMQNYPNPFNPTTTIQYSTDKRQFVKITIYDVLGREIVILVNEEKPAGEYKIEFDASKYNLSSGVYFCELKINGINSSRIKMVLIK